MPAEPRSWNIHAAIPRDEGTRGRDFDGLRLDDIWVCDEAGPRPDAPALYPNLAALEQIFMPGRDGPGLAQRGARGSRRPNSLPLPTSLTTSIRPP